MSETITVTGNVATDPEQRVVRGEDKVTSFRIAATERRFDDQSRTWVDRHTSYYSVSAFKVLGLNAFAALRRGQRVIVTGRLRVKEWDNGARQGVSAEITADGIGHDLLFGVTVLQRSSPSMPAAQTQSDEARPSAPASQQIVPVDVVSPDVDPSGWGIPQSVGPASGDTPF